MWVKIRLTDTPTYTYNNHIREILNDQFIKTVLYKLTITVHGHPLAVTIHTHNVYTAIWYLNCVVIIMCVVSTNWNCWTV